MPQARTTKITESVRAWASEERMNPVLIGIVIASVLALLGVAGDFFIKLSSATEHPYKSWSFYVGLIIYALTAFGWVYAFRYLKLSTLGVIYGVVTVLALVVLGVLYFKESINIYEAFGVVLGISSIVLLSRFS
jgi:small multidrug resistance pump